MLPSRPATGGPFARSVREALESAVSPETALHVLDEALDQAGMNAVPEEIEPFRRFCEGPFRRAVVGTLGKTAIEQVFERLGHVLWMATSDVNALETARAWSRGDIQARDDDSGVRNVGPEERLTPTPSEGDARDSSTRAREGSQPRGASGSQPRGTSGSQPRTSVDPRSEPEDAGRMPMVPSPRTGSVTLGRMPTIQQPAQRTTMEIRAAGSSDPRSASSPPPRRDSASLLHRDSPQREGSRPSPTPRHDAPSSVLVVTLDTRLVNDLRLELKDHCPVRCIHEPSEIASAVITGGSRLVVLIDTALPSIGVPTFAGLAPVLPAGTRVILWGASLRQQQRLASMFPIASSWISSNGAPNAGRFILES